MKIRNKKLLTKSIAMAIFMSSTLYTMPITHAHLIIIHCLVVVV